MNKTNLKRRFKKQENLLEERKGKLKWRTLLKGKL